MEIISNYATLKSEVNFCCILLGDLHLKYFISWGFHQTLLVANLSHGKPTMGKQLLHIPPLPIIDSFTETKFLEFYFWIKTVNISVITTLWKLFFEI